MAYRRSEENLREAAEFQLQAIQLSAREFDSGAIGEAARLATAVFLLIGRGMRHHTSIFDSAGQQEKRLYRSTLGEANARGSQLIVCRLEKVDTDIWQISACARGKEALSEGRDLPFDEWWSETVIDTEECKLTREQIVRILRDKNGGAHFDAEVEDPLVAAVLQGRLGGFYYINQDGESQPVPGSLENCMRQIVEELWFSLKHLPKGEGLTG